MGIATIIRAVLMPGGIVATNIRTRMLVAKGKESRDPSVR